MNTEKKLLAIRTWTVNFEANHYNTGFDIDYSYDIVYKFVWNMVWRIEYEKDEH